MAFFKRLFVFAFLLGPLASLASVAERGGVCSGFLSSEEELVQAKLSSIMDRITQVFGIQFKSHSEPPVSPVYHASSMMGEYTVYLPRQHFKDPKAALEELKKFEKKLFMQHNLTVMGLSPWPNVLSSKMGFELFSENPEPGSTIEWISARTRRYNIRVFIDDDQFVGKKEKFEAFAENYRVYLRSSILDRLETPQGKSTVAHEIHHAVSFMKCGLRLINCGSQIAFKSEEIHLVTGGSLENLTEEEEVYATFFSSDEAEAYRLSGDILVDPEKKKEMYDRSDRFYIAQNYYLKEALKEIENTSFIADPSPSITVHYNGKAVSVLLPRFDFRSSEEARGIYKGIIQERLRVLNNHYEALKKKRRRLQ